MNKYGIIFCGYNTSDYLKESLKPWIQARSEETGDSKYVIYGLSVPFKDFVFDKDDGTFDIFESAIANDEIDLAFMDSTKQYTEVEARTFAMNALLSNFPDITHIWQVDSDEFFTVDQIEKIDRFVKKNDNIDWFRISYKNYVFDDKTYMVYPFTPPRIHRAKLKNGRTISQFVQDNDIEYTGPHARHQSYFSNMIIPKHFVWVKHLTWLSNERSRKKIEYQRKRWGHCSFAWDEANKSVVFDIDFYKKNGQPLPEIEIE